ncbi:MAG: glycosyltransferase [Candidatus Helarchaeota archaeon]
MIIIVEKKIGILSYRFPPLNGRDADFCSSLFKNFDKLRIKSYVITSKLDFYENYIRDNKLHNKMIFRIREFFIIKFLRRYKIFRVIFRYLLFPDQYVSWILYSLIRGTHIIKKNKITHLFVMVPPASNLILGYMLKKLTNIKLMIYLADLWTQNPYLNLKKRYYYFIAKHLERKILNETDLIFIASEKYIDILNNIKINSSKIFFIPFGYDDSAFRNISPIQFKRFTILHAGTLYPGNYVNPIHFFQAIKLLLDERKDLSDKFQIIFCGKYPKYVEKLVKEMNLNNVQLLGFISKKSTIELMISSDLNLVLLYPKKETEIIIPSKIYEYMRAKKPILGLVPINGICAKLITQNKVGVVIDPKKIKEIKDFLIKKINYFIKSKKLVEYPDNEIKKYERLNLTKRILYLIKKIEQKS